MSARRLLLLGPPGAGKGTQGRLLAARLGIPVIATGDMLRQAVEAGTELGARAQAFLQAGKLAPDEVVVSVAETRLNREDARRGFILDGFPRTVAQADALAATLEKLGVALERCLMVTVSENELVERLLKRASIEGRADDNEAAIRVRMAEYHAKTAPLSEYYRRRNLLVEVSGEGSVEAVSRRIRAALETHAAEEERT